MELLSSPELPPTSDPALIDDWYQLGQNAIILPSSTYSDELEAIHLTHDEDVARKTEAGEVIQHRAWKLAEAFRSDPDNLPDTPLRYRKPNTSLATVQVPSSPLDKMPSIISSPVTYPMSSSPPVKKRPPPTSTLSQKPKTVGGFLLDDSDDENVDDIKEPPSKRQMLDELRSPPLQAIRPNEERLNRVTNAISQEHPGKGGSKVLGGFLIEDDEEELESASPAKTMQDSTDEHVLASTTEEQQLTKVSVSSFLFGHFTDRREVRTCSGKSINVRPKQKVVPATFEEMVAARSTTKQGRAKKSYYGIDIHQLIDEAAKENVYEEIRKSKAEMPLPSIERTPKAKARRTMMWTEKYRARRFFDLVGDDRTHREVLRWLKGWDSIVFPRSGKSKPTVAKTSGMNGEVDEKPHRKILLLTGPPGLGKTTLAHVCAMQAGYEVMEINASDERSSNVVKGRIRTTVGTESVKTIAGPPKDGQVQKMARPVCVVVDEVDGVVSGSGGSGDGGFIKALIDLIQLDAKNSPGISTEATITTRKKKGDNFRLLRPLILICNDVYHPSLRPLRQSSFAEVIHIRKPPLEAAVNRMKSVFEKEGVACDTDGVRKLCEATWGMSSGPEARLDASGTGEGDLRSLLVVGEWVAGKLRASTESKPKLTRKWVEHNILSELSHGGGGARGVGRGGVKEVVSRVFLTGAGFPKSTSTPIMPLTRSGDPTIPRTKLHASELDKKAGMDRLREMVDTSGDIDRIITDIFSMYPSQPFNDDTILSKPDAAYEWLYFHDSCSSRVFSDQDWELMPYLSQPILACHHLFASPARHAHSFEQKTWGNEGGEAGAEKEVPFSGPKADYDAREAEKACRATIQELQSNLNATLLRSFRSPEDIATHFLPYLVRMLTPDVKPIIVGGSGDQKGIASVRKEGEREMVRRAVDVMSGVGVKFERGRLEGDFSHRGTQWVYRMEPPIDTLTDFLTASTAGSPAIAPVRYAVRQVLDQEYLKNVVVRENATRQARYRTGNPQADYDCIQNHDDVGIESKRAEILPLESIPTTKKDFFGRVKDQASEDSDQNTEGARKGQRGKGKGKDDNKVWVSFHEGYSNAVRKPITVEELMRGL